ncbi:MAG: ATP-dependent Clp protease proteolytic subunit [Aliivibrio sp.]|uniref:Clp protease ClpP n=1 Tax=Aliivibrio sp. TaxID=1872443 RepID=UPI001A39FAAB|nr:ATP-dependent Clp protease proteolytic subunit [Aliivibrio sp.]
MSRKSYRVEAKKNKAIEVFLYGEIWGAYQAEQLGIELKKYENTHTLCKVRVNCPGGSVVDGIAMWNLMLSCEMKFEFWIDGIAASMGADLCMLPGAKVYCAKYAKVMLHRISCGGEGSPDDLRRVAGMAEDFENNIIESVANKTGLTEEKVREKWFDGADHWMNADQALADGLIDGIVEGNEKLSVSEEINNAQEAYTYFNNLLNPNEMEFKNKAKFVAALGLGETASDEAVLEAALKAVGEKNTLTARVGTLESEKAVLQAKVDAGEKKDKDDREATIKNLLDKAIEGKKLTAKMREHYENLFSKDFESTKIIVENLPSVQNLSNLTKGGGGEDRRGWTFKDWQKKDSKGLKNMKKDNPDSYKSLFKSQYDKDPEM